MYRLDIKAMSVNDRSCVQRGRIKKTKAFVKYCDDLQIILPKMKDDFKLEGCLILKLVIGFSNPRSDLDNVIKPFQDALQIKYKFNDSQIYRIEADKDIVVAGKEYIEFDIIKMVTSC